MQPALVEAIDLAPTFLDALGLPSAPEWLEGRSLQGLLHRGAEPPWREAVFSENSYAFRDRVRLPLGREVDECLMTMVRTERWKYVHYAGLRPQLFDLLNDPDEYRDLGASADHAAVREQMAARLFDWLRARKRFPTISHDDIAQWNRRELETGIKIGFW